MQHAILTIKGGAESLSAELQELGIKSEIKGPDWCMADLSSVQVDLLHKRSQAATQIMQFIALCSRQDIETVAKTLKPREGSFCLRATGEERLELQEDIGALIHEVTGSAVNLTKPDTTYYLHETDGSFIFGIDLFGALAKRHYKIITGSHSLTGPFAYCSLRAAGWEPRKNLVVWPCATGELAIEAALASSEKSPRAYELRVMDEVKPKNKIIAADPKLSMVRSCEKNAKIAGIHQHITFSRQDADWLDTKYDEREVTFIIGLLPNLGIYTKLANEMHYQLDFILKAKAIAAFLCVNDISAEKLEESFQGYEKSRKYLWSGKHCYTLVTLIKPTKTKKTGAN